MMEYVRTEELTQKELGEMIQRFAPKDLELVYIMPNGEAINTTVKI